jgi:hypothetical protein
MRWRWCVFAQSPSASSGAQKRHAHADDASGLDLIDQLSAIHCDAPSQTAMGN